MKKGYVALCNSNDHLWWCVYILYTNCTLKRVFKSLRFQATKTLLSC